MHDARREILGDSERLQARSIAVHLLGVTMFFQEYIVLEHNVEEMVKFNVLKWNIETMVSMYNFQTLEHEISCT